MNAPIDPALLAGLGIPGAIAKREPDAVFAWFSTRRLVIMKDGDAISLSADDVSNLARFVDRFDQGAL